MPTYIRAALRTLLGLIFVIFGLNGFLHFLPMPPVPTPAAAFSGPLFATGYMIPLLFATQVLGGVLLLGVPGERQLAPAP